MGRVLTPETVADLERTFSMPVLFLHLWLDPDDDNPDATPDYRFVCHDRALELAGVPYQKLGFLLGTVDQSLAQAYPDSIQLAIVSTPDTTSPIALPDLAARGRLIGARVRIFQVALYHVDSTLHSRVRVDARVDGVAFEASGCILSLASQSLMRRTELPRRCLGPQCQWQFGGPGCGVDASTYRVTVTAETGSTTRRIIDTTVLDSSALANGANHFMGGYVQALSGDYKNVSSPIFKFDTTNRALDLQIPLDIPSAEIVGTQFYAVPGCLHHPMDCEIRYNNLDNEGGFHTAPRAAHLKSPGDYRV
jgi:uncharacterized phage protein (TIGR02218 family)